LPQNVRYPCTPQSRVFKSDPALALEEDIRQTCDRFSLCSFAIHQRAQFLLLSLVRSHREKELGNSIDIARDLLEIRPRQFNCRVKLLRMHSFCYALGSHEPGYRNKSVSRAWDHPSTSLAYQNILSASACTVRSIDPGVCHPMAAF
jgi:hypothetical protein